MSARKLRNTAVVTATFAVATLSGLLIGQSMRVTEGGAWVAVLSLSALLSLVLRSGPEARRSGWIFAYFGAFYGNVFGVLGRAFSGYIDAAAWVAPAVTLALSAYLAAWPALAVRAIQPVLAAGGVLPRALAIAGALTLSDWIRSQAPVGAPWAILAYAFPDPLLLRLAPLGGAWLAQWLLLLGLGLIVQCRTWRGSIVAVLAVGLLVCLHLPWSLVRPVSAWAAVEPGEDADSILVTAVPWGVPPQDKYDVRRLRDRTRHLLQLARQASGDVVIFPETTLPLPWEQFPASVREAFQAEADARPAGAVIIGAFREHRGQAFNTAVVLRAGRPPAFVDKAVLMPIGERYPGWLRRLVGHWHDIPADLAAGPPDAPHALLADANLPGILICNEANAPDLAAGRLSSMHWGALISDLGWFDGQDVEFHELRAAQWRAAEASRWLLVLRAQRGATLISPRGKVAQRSPVPGDSWAISVPRRSGIPPFALAPSAVPILIAGMTLYLYLTVVFRIRDAC